jgi:two-component system cell cycle sensor histidine kinase/response regulator CckA
MASAARSVYLRFALLAGIALLVAGSVGIWRERVGATHRAQLAVWRDAAFMAERLGTDDLARTALFQPATGETQILLDNVFGQAAVTPGIVRVTLIQTDGTVTYSSNHDLIGTTTDRPDLLRGALTTGRSYAVSSAEGKRVLVSYVPVRWVLSGSGGPSGALAVYRDYAPVDAEIRQTVRGEAEMTGLALLLLYAAMFPILHGITRALAQRNREKLELERQLGRAHRAEAVGRLAGSVAHDFNNLLTGIRAYADLVVGGVPPDSPARWHGEEIRKATSRGAALTRHLLDFERRGPAQPKVLDLNALLDETLPLLQRLIGDNVVLDVERAQAEIRVEADPDQLEQLVVSLLLNARDALPDGGTIRLRAGTDGGSALLAVSDDGAQSEQRQGLELAALWGLVRGNGGTIEVEADPETGTHVRVRLPLAAGPVAEPAREPEAPAVHEPSSATILLVEDEEIVRAVVREVLETDGYTVLAAHNGRLALELCAQYEGTIDLVLSDVVMPEIGGIELAETLRTDYPEIAVVLMSGYPKHDTALAETRMRWLQKPFTHAELLAEVAGALGAGTPTAA